MDSVHGVVTYLFRHLCPINCLNESVGFVVSSVCSFSGTDVTPKHISSSIVYCLSFLSATVVLAAYSGILISFITNQEDAIRVDDLDGLLHSETYKFGALQDSAELTFFSVRIVITTSIH